MKNNTLTKSQKILQTSSCGEPIFKAEKYNAQIGTFSDVEADFCLVAKGDSMINARIFDGDILFIKRCDTVKDGDIAVILIGEDVTVKRFYFDRESVTITLMPENPSFRAIRITGKDIENVQVIGKVIIGQYLVQ